MAERNPHARTSGILHRRCPYLGRRHQWADLSAEASAGAPWGPLGTDVSASSQDGQLKLTR